MTCNPGGSTDAVRCGVYCSLVPNQNGGPLSVIPNHGESVVNLHDEIAAARDGHVEEVWQIRGRGKIR